MEPVMKVVWDSCAAETLMTVPAAWATPATIKWPPAGSRVDSQSWYWVMGSLSASLTENRLDSDMLSLCGSVTFAVVTTGGLSGGTVIVKGAQAALSAALQNVPSKARICSAALIVPVMKDVWANCAADM